MREVDPEPGHGHSHPPAHDEAQSAETRQETVDRVLAETRQDDVEAAQGSDPGADASTRRGFNRAVWLRAGMGFVGGLALGAAIILVANAVQPEALGEPSGMALVGAIFVTGLLMGVIVAIITAFVTLEREDGRIEREVEKDVGGNQPSPADASEPELDVESRR